MLEKKPWKDCELEEELRECMGELAWYRDKLKHCRQELKYYQKKLKQCEEELSGEEEEERKKRKHRRDRYYDEDCVRDDEKDRKGSDNNKCRHKDEDFSDWKDRKDHKYCNDRKDHKPHYKDKESFKDELQQYINKRVAIGTGGQTQDVVIIEVEDNYVKAMVVDSGAIVTFQISRINYVEASS